MITRRLFGQGLAGTLASALTGCGTPEHIVRKFGERCALPQEKDMLRIDMHCHLMNQKDVDGAAFITRRQTNFDEGHPVIEGLTGVLARSILEFLDLGTHTALADAEFLTGRRTPKIDLSDPAAFCREAYRKQRGLYIEYRLPDNRNRLGDGRYTGFASHRSRNAAALMAMAPDIDIFTPSMVDLYDRPNNERDTPYTQAPFYKALHCVTRGRFLPLVSFSPARQFKEDPKCTGKPGTPLGLVRECITRHGFIGVKLHPSSGFNPYKNANFGCPNTPLQMQETLSVEEAKVYDTAMAKLFALCNELQVPILTHGSDSLYANKSCMHRGDKPEQWTNSPQHWVNALEAHKLPNLKVCLAHFASRFHDQLKLQTDDDPYGKGSNQRLHVEYDDKLRSQLKPSAWLQVALGNMTKATGDGGLYLDLSFMPDLALSAARLQPGKWTHDFDMVSRKLVEMKGKNFYTGRYARAFKKFIEDHGQKPWGLHDRVMYGTDWHMPAMSVFGRGNQYRRLIESVLPDPATGPARRKIMGLNAVKFFGLQKGGCNRQRLVDFYKRHGIELDSVPWIKRVDRAWPTT